MEKAFYVNMKYLFLLFLFILPIQADAVWFSSEWDYKVKVEINPNKVASTTAITSFPVYVDLAGMPASFWTNASNTGADIRVVESDDTTETAFEVVTFATTTKRGELHFMADSLGTTSTSTFYIYYGNATATAYASTDTYGRNAVWSSYEAVWHLKDTDESSDGNLDFSQLGTVLFTTDGKIEKSAGPFGSGKGLTQTSQPTIGTGGFTMSGWFFASSLAGGVNKVLYSYNSDENTPLINGTQKLAWYHNNQGTGGAFRITGGTTLAINTKYYYTLVGNGGADGSRNVKLYLNAVQEGSTYTGNYNLDEVSVKYGIHNAGGSTEPFTNGYLDETRFAKTERSTSWITTEYNNQSATSTFFYNGPEETETVIEPEATTTSSTVIKGGLIIKNATVIK
jgi:hypothetical protein